MAPKPTLLSKYEVGLLSWSKEWMMSEKLDGWRVMYDAESETFYSRSGNVLLLPGRFYEAAKAFAAMATVTMLDGELWCGRRTGSGAVPSGMVHDDPKMRYMVFDAWTAPNPHPSAIVRYREFENAGNDIVMPVEQVVVAGEDVAQIDAFFDKIVKEGGEGIVLKTIKMSVFTDGCRVSTYLKRKPFETDEFEVVGHHNTDKAAAKGEGYVSSLVLASRDGSKRFKTFKVSYKNFIAPAVGEMVTVRYSDTTVTGLPKFPVYVGKTNDKTSTASGKTSTASGNASGKTNVVNKVSEQPSTPSLVMPAFAKLKITTPTSEAKTQTNVEASAKTQVEASAKTYAEWEANGGYELSNGESVLVISAANPSILYKVAKAASGTSVYCSCPAWKYQKLNPAVRTCKHCIAVCGAKAERLRCAQATMCLQQMNDLMGKTYKI